MIIKNGVSEIELWVTLGLPSEKIVRQSCAKAKEVIIYSYGGRTAEIWWDKIKNSTTRFENLKVINLVEAETNELAQQVNRASRTAAGREAALRRRGRLSHLCDARGGG